MKFGIREKITIVLCISMEAAFLEFWLRLGGKSLWDYIQHLVPRFYM